MTKRRRSYISKKDIISKIKIKKLVIYELTKNPNNILSY